MDTLGLNLCKGRKTPRQLIDYSEEELTKIFEKKCKAIRKDPGSYFLGVLCFSYLGNGNNPKDHSMHDVHEAYQMLLKVIKTKNMFLSNFQKKKPVDSKEQVSKAALIFKKKATK